MRYVSIDVETTGLDPAVHQIVEFAAVIDDLADPRPLEELPRLQAFVKPESGVYVVDAYCLDLHREIWPKLSGRVPPAEGERVVGDYELHRLFADWLVANGHAWKHGGRSRLTFTPAGKNYYRFDHRFLSRLKHWGLCGINERGRALDPATLFARPGDAEPPDLATCLARAGLDPAVKHRAMDDALAVVRLLRVGILGRATP